MSTTFEVEVANFLAFVGAAGSRKPNSVFILVMGMTGSGKSSFIADCTGREDAKIGHDLESCTNSVAVFREEIHGRDVYLIDTPGFDDTNKEDVEILTTIAHYLSVSYANHVFINGILYLHRVSDTRIGSSTRRNFDMMRALYGEDQLENVAVVTTMWGPHHSETELAKQRSREQELRDKYLSDMFGKGSQLIRHDKCSRLSERRTSAKDILTGVVELWEDTQVTLQIQHEMVDLKMTLKETSAGKVLERYIREHEKSYARDLKQSGLLSNLPYHDSDETQLHTATHALSDPHHSEGIQRMLTENNQALESMRLSLFDIHAKQKQKFLDRISILQNEWEESLRQMEEEYRLKEIEYRRYQLEERGKALEEERKNSEELQASSRLMRQREKEYRLKELEYRSQQLEEREKGFEQKTIISQDLEASTKLVTTEVNRQQHPTQENAGKCYRHREAEKGGAAITRDTSRRHHPRRDNNRQRGKAREDELERLRLDVEKLRRETKSKLSTTEKVKSEWKGPLVEGLVTGGLGLVGTCITAGLLCCVQ
ncbi:hypothetical protein F4803DRAFT_512300 [Xylaria telfairii]|nr:hypothetical protein F4803DRAFT_512300 [Xylaria telfairii]